MLYDLVWCHIRKGVKKMKTIRTMLVVFMVIAMITLPVLGEVSIAEGTAYASGLGALVTVSGSSTSGDASADAESWAVGTDVFAKVNAYAGPGEDDDSTIADVGTSAEGIVSYSWAGASVDNEIGYVSVNFDALASGLPAETSAGALAKVQEDEIYAIGGAEGSGLIAGTVDGNNVAAESYEDANLVASMSNEASVAPGGYTIVSTTGTGGEGWLNFDGSALAVGFGANIFGHGAAWIGEIED